MPTLFCPRCGSKGHVDQKKEHVEIGRAEPLDLYLYTCQDCGNKWYDAADVIALVVSYGAQTAKGG